MRGVVEFMTSVLVIDDCPEFRRVMCHLLSSLGYAGNEAADGKQGLKSYQSDPTDIVLLDIYMPVMDGIETLDQLLRHDPKAKVIAMTGGWNLSKSAVLEPALLMGARKTLHKPITKGMLQTAIEELLAMPT